MRFRLQDDLPYVTVSLVYRNQPIAFDNVLLDTGSAGTIFSADKVLAIGLQLEPTDFIHRIRGVGGSEFVFTKRVDRIVLDDSSAGNFEVEIGAMNYGFEIDGILGTDFLRQVGAVIDFGQIEIHG